MLEQYGNDAPWASYVNDPSLSLPLLQALSSWFVILQPKARPASLDDPTDNYELRTGSGDGPAPPRVSTGVFGGVGTPGPAIRGSDRFVFRIQRGPQSRFDFVSVGRNAGNDLYVPDDSISRFHAFFRETPAGLMIVDAKSQNGTWVRGQRVPTQAEGEPVRIASGDPVRFGEIHGVVVDAAGPFALTRTR